MPLRTCRRAAHALRLGQERFHEGELFVAEVGFIPLGFHTSLYAKSTIRTGSYNPTFPTKGSEKWISPWHLGLNQGPIVLMIENFRTGLIWRLLRKCPYLVNGLRRAGFKGGWLG